MIRNLIARREATAAAAEQTAAEHRTAADRLRKTGTSPLANRLIANREAAADRATEAAEQNRAAASRLSRVRINPRST
ncbi:hypothetical protein [Streptomyces lateritius]|uniref:hypothetical protein n=1 Tax=Streptomyces lateritius TaxID=67313 RepID=UPI001C8B823A|nr:hypothetical protein [Streptomyces lateritius]MBX9425450.1 hypothetical protein [Streptomyces lateritius]